MKNIRQISSTFKNATVHPESFQQLRYLLVWLIIISFSAIFIFVGYQYANRYGLVIGLFSSIGLVALLYFYDSIHLNSMFPTQELEGHDPWGILQKSNRLALSIGIHPPKVAIVDSRTPFVFTTGFVQRRSSLFVSTELLKRLSTEEVEAILTLELLCIKHHHTSIATAAATFNCLLRILGEILDLVLAPPFMHQHRALPLRPATFVLTPLMAIITRSFVSQRAVLNLDQAATQMLGEGHTLARALWKLDAYSKTLPLDISPADAHLFVVNPLAKRKWTQHFFTHPEIESRVRLLAGRYPL